jgi:hypothetical protein
MLVIISDCMGIGQQEFVPSGQMVNQHYCQEGLCLRGQVHQKYPTPQVEPQLVDLL